jgi:hypothetical protein
MDIGGPFLTKHRGRRTSFMVKEFVPVALGFQHAFISKRKITARRDDEVIQYANIHHLPASGEFFGDPQISGTGRQIS